MADFEIERPSVDVSPINPVYNVNQPHFTIEIHGGTQGQKGEKGDSGQDGRDGVDGINGIDGQDGVGVESIEQTTTSHESGGTNIITATLTDGSQSFFEIMNGEEGSGSDIFYVTQDDTTYTYDQISGLIQDGYEIVLDASDLTNDARFVNIAYLGHNAMTFYFLDYDTTTSYQFSFVHSQWIKNTEQLAYDVDIPTKVSDLSNDSGFITSSTVSDALEFASWFTFVDSDSNNCKVVYDGNRIGDSDMAYVGTNAIMHNDSGTFVSLDEVIDGKQDVINNNNKLDYSYLSNTPTIPDELSDLSDDTTHRLVTDTEKTTWSGKQDALVSGTNIKTINNNSLLGSGNITISGGGTATDVQINSTSIVVSDVANILTESAYDSSTNKLATMSDVPDVSGFIDKDVNNLTNYSLTTTLQANKSITKGIEYIVGTQASATNAWTGTSTDTGCSSGNIYTGKVIIYHLPIAGTSSAATLNLTLPDGTTTGAKNIYRQASSTVTTTFAADCDILMVYDGTQWKVNAYVDTTNSNSIGYQIRTDKGVYVNGASTSIYRYQLLVQTENGLEPFTSTSNKTGTTKTQLSPKYLPGGDIRYYSSTTEITTGSDITSGSLWMQYHLDLRYSFNITSTQFTAKKPVYMKMSVNADGTLSPVYSALSGGHPLTQTLPTTADGYVYLHLGTAYSAYQLQLEIIHPMYEYKNGKLREYISETGGGGTITDVQVNSTSVVAGGVANVLTETAYDASTNKIATMSDLPTVPTNISSFVNDSGYITGISSGDVTTALGFTPYDASNPSGYISSYTETDPIFTASDAYGITSSDITNWNNKSNFSGSYNDLTDKPTIPTVNNATLTIQKNGTTVKTFTANASSNVTANITVPTNTSDLNNDSGFTTNTGTITSVKMNGTTVSSSGEADLGTVLTSHQSIKTINSNSLVGSGNLTLPVITELTSPVILNNLTDGYYRLPAGCVLKYKESENDNNPETLTTIGSSALMQFKIKEDNGYPIFSYWIFEDNNDAEYDSGEGTVVQTSGGTLIKYGLVSPYTADVWSSGELDLSSVIKTSDIVDNLTSTSTNKPLSAKQGKVLKDSIPTITLSTTTWIDSLF